MDYEAFMDMAEKLRNLKMFPNFQITYSLLCALSVRKDLGSEAKDFSRKHPLACWISTMLVMFSGGMIFNGLLGQPIMTSFKHTPDILIGTFIWYLVFYAPFDIGYKIGIFFPINFIASAMLEVNRTKTVFYAITHVAELYPDSWAIMISIGTLRGNSTGFIKLLARLIRGVWTPSAMEFMHPSLKTKACLLASIIIVLNLKTDWIQAPPALIYFCIATLLVYIKLLAMLLDVHDPFVPFENFCSAVLFGGISDCLDTILRRTQSKKCTCKYE